ncbi:ABC transporter substrate-binding protein [Azospirillum palustre]|uniref:ABC transporter substrate-binding protein n=1 Tax=Azospirillum palustre TaxID=2044885 RepID=A0A2B8BG47_9PROT|nr:transporter substrate-binding protein [Azospirillum palustre]PGH56352.1 ABC transporter substrate-binding protein [Azospirillum palustre]
MTFTRRNFLKSTAVAGVAGSVGFPHIWIKDSGAAWAANGEIKVGVLFSLTGTTAVVEKSMHNATMMAIDEINAGGGINGMKLTAIVEDPASDPATFADKANKLVLNDKCVSVFGSYTSASRKAVLPVFEKRKNLYWYPTLYEGRECSKNVMYTGAVPNQQQKEFIPWLVKTFGKKFYLIGSNYIYPKEENNVCKILLKELGGEVVGEEYVPLGHSEFGSVLNKFRETKPDVIFSTVVGDSVIALHKQYKAAGFSPDKMPMASLTTSEVEIAAMGGEYAAGHFTSAPYFMGHQSKENEVFVENYRKRFGKDSVTHFVSEAAYFQMHLFRKAVEKIGKGDVTPIAVRDATAGLEIMAPQGKVKVDGDNLHCYLWPKIGQAQADGQFKVIQQSSDWVKPEPYWAYPGQSCTKDGLKGA